jgi:hypothetical protein
MTTTKSSYASILSIGADDYIPSAPLPIVPPIPVPRWGSMKIDYDEIITKAFTVVPLRPTAAWVLLRNIYYEYPERIEVLSAPHQNFNGDPLHISIKVLGNNCGSYYNTVHINGRFVGSTVKTHTRWWNETMEIQICVKREAGDTVLSREMIADWRKETTSPPTRD